MMKSSVGMPVREYTKVVAIACAGRTGPARLDRCRWGGVDARAVEREFLPHSDECGPASRCLPVRLPALLPAKITHGHDHPAAIALDHDAMDELGRNRFTAR